MIIGVIGGRDASVEARKIAEKVGEIIAKRKHILICGGMGGVMEAACRGAKRKKGLTVGILPGKSKKEANRYIDVPVVTAMSHARNAILVRSADGLIAVGGKFGTLSEIALAKACDKTVVGMKTWEIEGVVKFNTPEKAIRYLEKNAL